jgi:hypothetical protein
MTKKPTGALSQFFRARETAFEEKLPACGKHSQKPVA